MQILLNNKYKIESALGQGAMGRVYLAKNIENNCYFAIKECISQNPKILERIRREFYFLTRLNHPNIVRGVDFFYEKQRYFIVMDYIQGVTIQDLLKRNLYAVDFNKKLEIATQICHAVSTLNKAQIIHRDIKPSNIMLEGNNLVPKLLDLGIAKMQSLQQLTQPGKVIGTPQYMSPEQIEDQVAHNSDVFSLAVVLYQLFAGMEHSPFHDSSVTNIFKNVLRMTLPPLHEFIGENTPQIKYISKILDQSLLKDPQKRTACSETMYNLLLNCLQNSLTEKSSPIDKKYSPTDKTPQQEYFPANVKEKTLPKRFIFIPILLAIIISIGLYSLGSGHSISKKRQNTKRQNTITKKSPQKTALPKKAAKKIQSSEKNKSIQRNKMIVAYYTLGHSYLKVDNYEKALPHFSKAIELDNNYIEAYKSRGLCYFYTAKYNHAIHDFQKVVRLAPHLEEKVRSYINKAKKLRK
ncbi:protein kinase [Candidatus Uabimicrobium sp. HlEnr_7]|uniref:protein kinase domain-containing protein n=1 Tax=Candidatus Uabimicrobium helgolandensis TaxID=3095367 RepID=UPI003557BBB8